MKKLMLGLMMAFAVTAEATTYNYTLNESLTATFDDATGVLTINGNGAMPNWKSSQEQSWSDVYYKIQSVVAEGVTSVGDYAFAGCYSLASVSLPNVTTIGNDAFYQCDSLTLVSLPNATTIENNAFANCGLTSVSLPNATTIGENAFYQCGSLTSVSLPNATTIEVNAFYGCGSLTSVYLPNATTIGWMAFASCEVLSSLVVNSDMAAKIKENWTYYGFDLTKLPTITVFQPLSEEVVKKAGYEYETQVSVSSVVKSGDTVLDENDYLASCTILGIQPQKKLNETDFKAVSKDAQVIGSDEIAVKKESIQAAKAETISIANNEIQLGVSVMSNSNITAEIAEWGKVNLASDDVKVENGNVVITIPVDSTSGFMILQSKDAKVQTDLQEPPHTTIR